MLTSPFVDYFCRIPTLLFISLMIFLLLNWPPRRFPDGSVPLTVPPEGGTEKMREALGSGSDLCAILQMVESVFCGRAQVFIDVGHRDSFCWGAARHQAWRPFIDPDTVCRRTPCATRHQLADRSPIMIS